MHLGSNMAVYLLVCIGRVISALIIIILKLPGHLSIDMQSVDTNHAERDKYLRGGAFFDLKNYPEMKFVNTHFSPAGEN